AGVRRAASGAGATGSGRRSDASVARALPQPGRLARLGEDLRQLLRSDHLELREGAIAGTLVGAPAPELRGMAKARALHVIVGDFDHQLGPQRHPGEVLVLAPAALHPRHALRAAALG